MWSTSSRRSGFIELRFALLAALLCARLVGPVSAQGNASLGEIRAFLFYKESGRLSENLLGREPEFVGWNTIIGAGEAEEPADDLLVVATVVASEETFDDHKLELWVTDGDGKVVAQRVVHGVLVTAKGEASNALWLSDVGCSGVLLLHARFRGEKRDGRIVLECGE